MIGAPFRLVQRRATTFMAAALFVGLIFPPVAAALRPIVFPFAVAVMLLSLVRTDLRAAMRYVRRPRAVLATTALAMVAAPVLLYAAGRVVVAPDSAILVGATLVAATPPVMSASAFAVLLGVDSAFAVATTVPANLATPVLMPLVVAGLLGLDLDIGAGALAARLGIMVGVAFVGAALLRRALGERGTVRFAHYVDGTMVVLLCTFGIGVMDGIAALIARDPWLVLLHAGGAFALSAALQVFGAAAAWSFGPMRALTVALLLGLRNGMLVLGAVGDAAGPEVRLFLIAFQFPLYILPALMQPVYARLNAHRAPR